MWENVFRSYLRKSTPPRRARKKSNKDHNLTETTLSQQVILNHTNQDPTPFSHQQQSQIEILDDPAYPVVTILKGVNLYYKSLIRI